MAFSRSWKLASSLKGRMFMSTFSRTSLLPLRSALRPISVILGIVVASESYYIWSQSKQVHESEDSKPLAPGYLNPALFKYNPVKSLSLELAEAKLRAAENKGKLGDIQFHTLNLASNHPVEDNHVHDVRPGTNANKWYYWGIFDGHAGWATSSMLKESLVPCVSEELQKQKSALPSSTIKQAFLSFDREIMDNAAKLVRELPTASPEGISALAPAVAGSCALLAMFDPTMSTLRVANVGDSRAVLGRYDESNGKYKAIQLSEDQTGFNKAEVARITTEHPGEDKILDPKSGRLMGLAVTRAFGDHRWKWPVDLIEKAQLKFRGSTPRPLTKTPPYMSAEPEVTETQIKSGIHGDFVILASDGLWDRISSAHAVQCVEQWLNTPEKERKIKPTVEQPDKENMLDAKFTWSALPEYFVVENDNAATHLVKNAFGGNRRTLFRGVMSAYPPLSRNIRDDITVHVIFFSSKTRIDTSERVGQLLQVVGESTNLGKVRT